MSIELRRSETFVGDFENAYQWYFDEAGGAVARRFLDSVWRAMELLTVRPGIGKVRRFRHPGLRGIRSYGVPAPFQAHLIFYRYSKKELSIERLMHGRRDLPRRLLEPPSTDRR